MAANRKRLAVLMAALLLVFGGLRVWLHLSPSSNFNLFGYNIHHLFTGVLLISLGGIPLVIGGALKKKTELIAVAIFGAGLAMALDEFVYLIATDGTDGAYLLPVSFWGGVVSIAIVAAYALALGLSKGSGRSL